VLFFTTAFMVWEEVVKLMEKDFNQTPLASFNGLFAVSVTVTGKV
jgi:hypothetical protein